ncbi:MAG TPA: hypothetical protein VFF40_14875 [Acidimicrobiia bacterium]|nr:hypothetical protein [Acidimicrobiia bacterium]
MRLIGSRIDRARGLGRTRRLVIGGEQVLPLALSLFAERGIEIEAAER